MSRVFSNKTLSNFFFQIKPQPLKCYKKKNSSLDDCNAEFFVEISYTYYAEFFYCNN